MCLTAGTSKAEGHEVTFLLLFYHHCIFFFIIFYLFLKKNGTFRLWNGQTSFKRGSGRVVSVQDIHVDVCVYTICREVFAHRYVCMYVHLPARPNSVSLNRVQLKKSLVCSCKNLTLKNKVAGVILCAKAVCKALVHVVHGGPGGI